METKKIYMTDLGDISIKGKKVFKYYQIFCLHHNSLYLKFNMQCNKYLYGIKICRAFQLLEMVYASVSQMHSHIRKKYGKCDVLVFTWK